jgi:hypothetical protein
MLPFDLSACKYFPRFFEVLPVYVRLSEQTTMFHNGIKLPADLKVALVT